MSTVAHIYAGAVRSTEGGRGGVFRQAVGSQGWDALTDGLPDGAGLHAITVHPENTDVVFIGTTKGAYRSTNRGDRWEPLALPDQVHMTFPCRVMRLDVDPARPDDVYACIEANGAMKSRDRGESWEDCTSDLLRFAEQEKYQSRIV